MDFKWKSSLMETGWGVILRSDRTTRQCLSGIRQALSVKEFVKKNNKAVNYDSARPNTLSSLYGMNDFPLHTDGADLDNPPRYIILSCPIPRDACTLVFNKINDQAITENMDRALFRVKKKHNFFYARFVERRAKGSMLRYNPMTHDAINQEAVAVANALEGLFNQSERINWHLVRLAVIDNWACLHGRESVSEKDVGRLHKFHLWV